MNSRSIPSRNIRPRVARATNSSSRTRRHLHWHRFGSVPGSRLPSGILPPIPSLLDETKTNTDCVGSALDVLRSTKRRKYCVEEHETHHTQDENDTNDSRPSRPQNLFVDHDTMPRSPQSFAPPSTTGVAQQQSRPNGWEWSMGILPPARLSEDEKRQQQRQEQQYSRMITPILYSVKFPSGRNRTTNCSQFLSAPEQGGVPSIGIRPCLETNAMAKH